MTVLAYVYMHDNCTALTAHVTSTIYKPGSVVITNLPLSGAVLGTNQLSYKEILAVIAGV